MESLGKAVNNISDLWEKFLNGNHGLLGEIFSDQYEELYYYGLKLVSAPDLVKDTIQDLFTDIWTRKGRISDIKNIRAYLFVSLRRELLRRVDRLRKENINIGQETEPFSFSTEDFLIKQEEDSLLSITIVESLQKLTERQREVIMLRFAHELEFSEIGLIMEMNLQSVRNLLFRALEKLRNEVNEKNIDGSLDIDFILLITFQKRKSNFFAEELSIK